MERGVALAQLCAPALDASVSRATPTRVSPFGCDEGQAYRCATGIVASCAANAVVGACVHGCVAEGVSVEDDIAVSREAAFAILCSR